MIPTLTEWSSLISHEEEREIVCSLCLMVLLLLQMAWHFYDWGNKILTVKLTQLMNEQHAL